LIFRGGKLNRVMDVFRCPLALVQSALAPIGTLRDKLLVAKLRFQARVDAPSDGRTTESFLREFGFSEKMIDVFFRSFYGGIFLERALQTSSRMFEFTFRMFADGYATLPARGMQAIPDQLAGRLPQGTVRFNVAVSEVGASFVVLENGERMDADAVVLATDIATARRLVPAVPERSWRSVVGIYFSAPKSPLSEAIIALNGSGKGVVNNVCVLSDVAPGYAPDGRALISVSVLGEDDSVDVIDELETWFGPEVRDWSLLKTYKIKRALPDDSGVSEGRYDGMFVCGDHCESASIEGALVSGERTAEAILLNK
jgi:phytoene dehydrogenase-like protein